MDPLIGNVGEDLDVIADMKTAVTGNLITVTAHLGKTNLDITPDTTLATLTADEADYDAYAAQAVTFGAASVDDAGRAEVVGTQPEFRPGGAVVSNMIYYAWIENGAGLLLSAVKFTTPMQMASALDSILLTWRLRPVISGDCVIVS